MYQALYRKWRPRSFDDVVGQEHITETLKRQIVSGRLSHAYLFVGTRGTGKTSCAKILAKVANCENPVGGNPCNKCPSCRGIDSGAILDVEELDAASNNGVENIRTIREEAVYTPASVRKRVYIIDEVHMLSTPAFNALLKILEEPPEHLIFILATTEIQKVPATILSRCQRFSFKRLTPPQIAKRLAYVSEQEGIDLAADAAQLLSRLADGSMRDALSLLDQCHSEDTVDTGRVLSAIGLAGSGETASLFSAVARGDTAAVLQGFDRLYFGGKDPDSVLRELLALERDILINEVAPSGGEGLKSGSFDAGTLREFSSARSPERVLSDINAMQSALSEMTLGTERRITAEMCLIRMCEERLSPDIDALRSRVAKLEEAVRNAPAAATRPLVNGKEPAGPQTKEAVPVYTPDTTPEEVVPEETSDFVPRENVPASENQEKADEPEMQAGNFSAAWQSVLDMVKDKIDIPVYMFLSDTMHSEPSLVGGKLAIGTKSEIARSMLDQTGIKLLIKEAAEKVLSHPVTVFVTEFCDNKTANEDKLDALRRFGNIKFE
ncbi:MAG: DNA polymerase III subunit gamma/tau [Oscillospiraceae bacterium]